jgi:bacillithiol biosynthesis cysteine-adding enzyme BshC
MGVRAVPLFWLQTEDQDFAEVATTVVPVDNAPPLRLSLLEAPEAVRCSLADRVLGDDVAVLTDALADAMAALPASGEVLDLLRLHYRPGVSPGRAFAGVVGTLFAEDGLLLFDPRCRPVSEHATPLLRRALTDAPALELALESRVAALREAGFSEQIELRPGSPLVFFHLRDARGPRYRLTRCEGGYAIHGGDGALTDAELLRTLDHDPLRFSTSALLRPILQDTLFPTAVYVGGAAEVSYFAQLQPLYEAFDLEPPLIAERAHFRLVPPRVRSLLDKLALTPADLDLPRSELLEKAAVTGDADLRPGTQWGAELEQRLDRLAASHKDQALERAVERARSSILHALALLGERYQRITLERDQVRSSRLTRVEGWLRPEGSLQERVFGFPAFASFVGLDRFRRLLIDAVDPMNPGFREIDL